MQSAVTIYYSRSEILDLCLRFPNVSCLYTKIILGQYELHVYLENDMNIRMIYLGSLRPNQNTKVATATPADSHLLHKSCLARNSKKYIYL
jgi:hypothetical protein